MQGEFSVIGLPVLDKLCIFLATYQAPRHIYAVLKLLTYFSLHKKTLGEVESFCTNLD